MDISISKTKDNRFQNSLGGYDHQQVDEFVSDVLEELEELKETNRELKRQKVKLQQKVTLLGQMREEIVDLIVNSQNYSQKIEERARRQAVVTINFAQQEAKQIDNDAQRMAQKMIDDKIEEAKLQVESLAKLKQMIANYQSEVLQSFATQHQLYELSDDIVEVIDEKANSTDAQQSVPDVYEQQVNLGIIARPQDECPVMVHSLASSTNQSKIKISAIKTKFNANDEVEINLSLTISK